LKLSGVPQTNETVSAASGPKFTILWGHVEDLIDEPCLRNNMISR